MSTAFTPGATKSDGTNGCSGAIAVSLIAALLVADGGPVDELRDIPQDAQVIVLTALNRRRIPVYRIRYVVHSSGYP